MKTRDCSTLNLCQTQCHLRPIVVVIVRQSELQLPVQSVRITTNVASSYPAHGLSDFRQAGGTPIFSTDKTKILLKMAFNTMSLVISYYVSRYIFHK